MRRVHNLHECATTGAQNVRVVQRNLVYVVGLALELCYEDLLKGPEYFGQFGKVIKVQLRSNSLPHRHPLSFRGARKALQSGHGGGVWQVSKSWPAREKQEGVEAGWQGKGGGWAERLRCAVGTLTCAGLRVRRRRSR